MERRVDVCYVTRYFHCGGSDNFTGGRLLSARAHLIQFACGDRFIINARTAHSPFLLEFISRLCKRGRLRRNYVENSHQPERALAIVNPDIRVSRRERPLARWIYPGNIYRVRFSQKKKKMKREKKKKIAKSFPTRCTRFCAFLRNESVYRLSIAVRIQRHSNVAETVTETQLCQSPRRRPPRKK